MWSSLKKNWFSLSQVIVLILSGFMIVTTVSVPPTIAEVMEKQEATGEILYQSRHTLTDKNGHPWQTIAFKQVAPKGETLLYLRLEGILGITDLSPNKPLTFLNCQGQVIQATNKSQEIFPNASPAPHVRQYDLQPILDELEEGGSLCLRLPSADGSTIELDVPDAVIKEWQAIAQMEPKN
jgi:hypothetical protein